MTLATLTSALADRYRVERELGAGGMATVYLAHDLRHEREVAIKVLHPDLGAALGGDRFLTEIKTTAKLQHPHILPLLDSGSADGLLYYVMPFVSGETLRARLSRERQLPIDDALRIAREVADALGAAHALGIIHRDIKPENILLQGGHALVADFGIALAVQSAGGARMTQTGLSLGTPQYMSPEQATGERVIDARVDIYALGAVTYEMLAGEPPFTGPSVQAIIARVVSEEPRGLVSQRKSVPLSVERAVLHALEKLPADRFATAVEFVAALDARGVTSPFSGADVRSGAASARWFVVAAIVLAAVTLAAGWLLGRRPTKAVNAAMLGASVILPDSIPLEPLIPAPEGQVTFALSPDASRLVYVGRYGRGTRLYIRRLDEFVVRAVEGTEGASTPFFSPSGDTVAFFAGEQLKRLSLLDNRVSVVANIANDQFGGAWLPDGRLLVATTRARDLTMLSPTGDVIRTFECGYLCTFPEPLPDGRHVLAAGRTGVRVLDLETGTVRALVRWQAKSDSDAVRGVLPRYDGDGHLAWVGLDGELMVAPFDAERAVLTGAPVSLASGVRVETGRGGGQFAMSRTGVLAFAPGPLQSLGILVRADRRGVLDTLKVPAADYQSLDLTHDGRRLLTRVGGVVGDTAYHIIDIASGKDAVWANMPGGATYPEWSTDGRRLVFGNGGSAFISDPEVEAPPTRLPAKVHREFRLLADGKRYYSVGGDTSFIGWLDGSKPELKLVTSSIGTVAFSPDGDWMITEEAGAGGSVLVARALDGSSRRIVVSNEHIFSMVSWEVGAREAIVAALAPRTATSGATGGDLQGFWSVSYDPTSKELFGTPRLIFRAQVADFPGRNYSVGQDGKVFVFKQHISSAPPREVRVLTNWHQRIGRPAQAK
jgi:serine/threonine-protein kinase